MAIIKNENFILIQGWMINNLKLSGNDLLVYAIIYGFTQDGEQWFEGSRSYLGEWCNSTKQGIQKNLKRLVESNLILKKETFINNVKFCKYKANPEHTPQKEKNGVDVPKDTPSQHSLPGATVAPSKQSLPGGGQQSLLGGRQQSCPNNIDIDNIDINSIDNNNDHFSNFSKNDRIFMNADKKENLDFEKNQVSDSAINEKNSVLSANKSNSSNKRLNEEFNQVWDLYPKKQGKKPAQAAFIRARQNGTPLESIISGIKSYLDYIAAKKISQEYVKQGSTFFNQEAWNDDWTVKNEKYKFKPNYDIEVYERINRELFEAYPSGGNERRSDLYQFMNPKFNQNIRDLEEEND